MLYCFAMMIACNHAFNSSLNNFPGKDQHSYLSAVFPNLVGQATQQESFVNPVKSQPVSPLKETVSEITAIVKYTGQQFVNSFTQYSSFSGNFFIRYRKADIIFPFHYFW